VQRGWLVLRFWHLLSLDAPSVAALWAWGLARALHVAVSVDSLLLLSLGTWLLYVADRVLDGFGETRLRERHLFYIRHRAAAVAGAVPVCALLVWLGFMRMLPAARRADIVIFGVAAAYFLVVHLVVHLKGAKTGRWFPKELIVAVVFAAATGVPAWARLAGRGEIAGLGVLATLFAALCWINCIAIEKWEQASDNVVRMPVQGAVQGAVQGPPGHSSQGQIADFTTRWGQRHLRRVCAGVAVAAIAAAVISLCVGQMGVAVLAFAGALSAALFIALDRTPLPASQLRIAADAALLTPVLLVFLR
jgi:hypothetical protein